MLKNENVKFSNALKQIYKNNPTEILPNAFYKTKNILNQFTTEMKIIKDTVGKMKIHNRNKVMLYWHNNLKLVPKMKHKIMDSGFVLLNEKYLDDEIINSFKKKEKYFKLVNYPVITYSYKLDSRYKIINVDVNKELNKVSEFINNCYDKINVSGKQVKKWTESRVFNNNLWLWVKDKNAKSEAGLIIADFDESISEVSLEWVQIDPDYRRNGLGEMIVKELLYRVKGFADFVTVSGQIDNKTKPEKLYRKCGFSGDDIWYVLIQ